MKAAIYCRVSKTDQDATKQEMSCREYCLRNNIEIFKVYTDSGVSGAKVSRPAFNDLLSDMRQMKFNCVVVTKLDRMGRSLAHLIALIDEFNAKGVHFVAITQNIDTHSAMGKFQIAVFGAVAEFERNLISERTIEGLRYAKNVGKRGRDKKPRLKRGVLRARLGIGGKDNR